MGTKRILARLLCGLLAMALVGGAFFPRTAGAAGGLWTDTDATGAYLYADFSPFVDASLSEYRVGTPAQLAALSALTRSYVTLTDVTDGNGVTASQQSFSGKTILLTGDVDLSDHGWYPIGMYPNGYFHGTFNGQNHAVSGMAVDIVTVGRNAMGGLFGQTQGATIQNLRVSDSVKVTLEDATGSDTTTAFAYAGGVVGHVNASTISSCTFTGTVEALTTFTGGTTPSVAGRACAGGIAGASINDGVTIANCGVTAATIRADAARFNNIIYAHAGGVVGYCLGGLKIENSYAADVTVNATENPSSTGTHSGGILGEAYNAGSESGLSNSYYKGGLKFIANNDGGSQGAMPDTGNVKFTGSGALVSSGYGGQTSLLAALNAWVNAKNAAGGSYLAWAQGGGLPYLSANSAPIPVPAADVPKTGDGAPLALLCGLMLLSGTGLLASGIRRRRKEER